MGYQILRLFVVGVFLILIFPLNIFTLSETDEEDTSDSSEESDSKEDDFVYSVLHSAMDNLTTRVTSMSGTVTNTTTIVLTTPQNLTSYPPISSPKNDTNPVIIEDDDFDYDGRIQDWRTKDTLQGYLVSSDGLQFKSKLLKEKGLMQIRFDVGSAWTLVKEINRRNLDLKIMRWNTTNRISIKVPYGAIPQELKVVELPKYVDVFAPYGFLEFHPSRK